MTALSASGPCDAPREKRPPFFGLFPLWICPISDRERERERERKGERERERDRELRGELEMDIEMYQLDIYIERERENRILTNAFNPACTSMRIHPTHIWKFKKI